jgi:hypothetical protein
MKLFRILAAASLFFFFFRAATGGPSPALDKHRLKTTNLEEGDILFIRSHSANADAIAEVTKSDFTHCGIVFKDGQIWRVREGAGMHSKYLDIDQWQDKESKKGKDVIVQYEPITVCRVTALATLPKQEKESKLQKLRDEAKKLPETFYDSGFAWNNHYTVQGKEDHFSDNPNDPEYVYCSELVYKAFESAYGIKLGTVHKINDYPLTEKAKTILNLPGGRHCRGEKKYSESEDVIAPQDIFKSDQLKEVKVD